LKGRKKYASSPPPLSPLGKVEEGRRGSASISGNLFSPPAAKKGRKGGEKRKKPRERVSRRERGRSN